MYQHLEQGRISKDLDWTDVQDITQVLMQIGVNPLEYLSRIPFKYFAGLETVEYLTIPTNIKRIGPEAFFGCPNFWSVEMSEGVQEIGTKAFAQCPRLSEVLLPKSLIKVQEAAFVRCPRLRKVSYAGTMEELAKIKQCQELAPYGCKIVCTDGTVQWNYIRDSWMQVQED